MSKLSSIKTNNKKSVLFAGILILALSFLCSIKFGSISCSLKSVVNIILGKDEGVLNVILMDVRVPRAIIAIIVGANLSISGALLQAVMRNPLADPGVTGVSAGASLSAIIILLLFPTLTYLLPVVAFAGGAVACLMVYMLAWKNGIKPIRIILAGVAVNAILGGGTSLLSILHSDKIQGVLMWVNGSLAAKSWKDVYMLLPYSIIGQLLSVFCIRSANILQLGDDTATNLGKNVNRDRVIISAIAVYLAGVSVSVVGIIGFVGLVVPHISRLIIGSDYKYMLPLSILLGGSVLSIADTVARTIVAPIELPVGVIMAVLGGPFFLYLLRKGDA
ncbi:iron ABC transporter permease [Clostridiaceae bacterium M8S5]|nr:iron ABC transporter permease [Clostridiaceae bacterium M8S5]